MAGGRGPTGGGYEQWGFGGWGEVGTQSATIFVSG